MKFLTYALGSSSLTALIVYNSYLRYQQLYPTCLYLVTGKFNQMVLANFFILLLIMIGKVVKTLCFGSLREGEVEQIYDKLRQVVFDALLLATVFSSDLNSKFMGIFSIMIFISIFHWLAKARVDFMELQPNLSILKHFRIQALISVLFLIDGLYLFYVITKSYVHGPSFQILFGFEYALLLWSVGMVETKFLFNFLERILARPIRSKVGFLRLAEFIEELLRAVTLVAFFITLQAYYGIPLHLLRRIISSLNLLMRRFSELRDYYRLVLNLNNIFPAATPEELQENSLCVICREEMTEARKLPCGHLFHANCLCEWLSRSNECPTCRRSLVGHNAAPPPQRNLNQNQNQNPPRPAVQPVRAEIPRPNPPAVNFNAQVNQPQVNVNPRNEQPTLHEDRVEAPSFTPQQTSTTTTTGNRDVRPTSATKVPSAPQSPMVAPVELNYSQMESPTQSSETLDAKIDSLEQSVLLISQLLQDVQSQLSELRSLRNTPSRRSSPIALDKQEEFKAETPIRDEIDYSHDLEESLIPVRDENSESSLDSLRRRRLSRFSDAQ